MNAPSQFSRPNGRAPLGTPEAFLEPLVEYLGLAVLQCELAQKYADAGDGVGLGYSMRKFAAYAKAALGTYDDLRTWQSNRTEGGQ
jgi:hypothetical protein